jgi:hypothetical protein
MLTYKFDHELYESKQEEYDKQQKLIAEGDGDLVEEEMVEPVEPKNQFWNQRLLRNWLNQVNNINLLEEYCLILRSRLIIDGND